MADVTTSTWQGGRCVVRVDGRPVGEVVERRVKVRGQADARYRAVPIGDHPITEHETAGRAVDHLAALAGGAK